MAQTPFEIRTYTLASPTAAQLYSQRWKAHISSLEKFDITTIGVWSSGESQVVALVRYRDGDNPKETTSRYMQSQDFRNDMEGFDMKSIVKVESMLMASVEASPLK
jgi:hypothetical protein